MEEIAYKIILSESGTTSVNSVENVITKKRHLKMHQLSYCNKKACKCEGCGNSFHTYHSLSIHKEIHCGEKILKHDPQTDTLKKPYECGVCRRTFS